MWIQGNNEQACKGEIKSKFPILHYPKEDDSQTVLCSGQGNRCVNLLYLLNILTSQKGSSQILGKDQPASFHNLFVLLGRYKKSKVIKKNKKTNLFQPLRFFQGINDKDKLNLEFRTVQSVRTNSHILLMTAEAANASPPLANQQPQSQAAPQSHVGTEYNRYRRQSCSMVDFLAFFVIF